MQRLATAILLTSLVALPTACADSAADRGAPVQPVGGRHAASGDTGQAVIFLRDGRTIRAEKTERLGDRIRVETPTGRIELPSSAVGSIHRMEAPAGPPTSPAPAEVYRGLTQQMTDRVRGHIQEQVQP